MLRNDEALYRLTGREAKKKRKNRRQERSVESGRASEVIGKDHRVSPSQRGCSVTMSDTL